MGLHDLLIYAHATAGLIAFAIGCLILRPHPQRALGMFNIYFVSLWGMVALLIAVVLVDWNELEQTSRLVYGGLSLLGLYTGWRSWQARRVLERRSPSWHGAYVDHVGFTLISLFDGFVIVSSLDLNAPSWLVGVVGVFGIIVGRSVIIRVRERAEHTPEPKNT
jgi:hypothetical protein